MIAMTAVRASMVRRSSHIASSVFGIAFVLALALESRTSHACSVGRGNAPLFSYSGAVTIPVNVRGIPFAYGGGALDGGPPAWLVDAEGREVPTTIEPLLTQIGPAVSENLLVPTLSLVEGGSYTILVAAELEPARAVFSAAPAAPLPVPHLGASASAARVEGAGFFRPGESNFGGNCYRTTPSSVIDVTLTLGEDYRPYRALARFRVQGGSGWEYVEQPNEIVVLPDRAVPENLTYTYRVAHACDGRALDTKGTWLVDVYGVEEAKAEVAVDLHFSACDQNTPVTPAGATPPRSDEGGGCSTTPSTGEVTASAAPSILAAALLLARRRRRARAVTARAG